MSKIGLSGAVGLLNALRRHEHSSDADGGGNIYALRLGTQFGDFLFDTNTGKLTIFDAIGNLIFYIDTGGEIVRIKDNGGVTLFEVTATTASFRNLKLDDLAAPDDNTDLNATIAKHGLLPKGPNDTTKFLRGDITWAVPPAGSVSPFIGNVIYATISANQNNYSPAGLATANTLIINGNGAGRTITGLDTSGMTEGQQLWIGCVAMGGSNLTLAHASGSSSNGNKFACPSGSNYAIGTNHGGVMVQYLPTRDAVSPLLVMSR